MTHRTRRRYSTRLLLSCAALGAAGGLLVVALNYALVAIPPSTVSYSIYAATIGAWSLGPLVAMALFRLPGVALLTTVFAAIVNLIAPHGVAQLQTFVIAGILLELPFALALYRRFSDRYFWFAYPFSMLVMSAAYFAASLAADAIRLDEFLPWIALGTVALTAGIAVGVPVLSLGVARRLAEAGLGIRSTDVTPAPEPPTPRPAP